MYDCTKKIYRNNYLHGIALKYKPLYDRQDEIDYNEDIVTI